MSEISLYVPCYNAAETLQPCLEAVFAQTRPPEEVLVVDDGSRDATVEIASRFEVRVLSHGVNRGLGAGRNTAIRASKHPWVASLDSDCVASADWLEVLAGRLEEDATLVGVGGLLEETNRTGLADAWRTAHMRQHWGGSAVRNPPFLFGNNNLFRKDALERVGLYNESLRTNFEDVAMSEALGLAGGSLLYEPAAIVRHLRRDTLRSVIRGNWRWRFFGYRHDIVLSGLLRGLRDERLSELRYFLATDLRALDPLGALVSLAAVGFAVASDVGYLLRHYGERRLHDPPPPPGPGPC